MWTISGCKLNQEEPRLRTTVLMFVYSMLRVNPRVWKTCHRLCIPQTSPSSSATVSREGSSCDQSVAITSRHGHAPASSLILPAGNHCLPL